MFLHSLFHDNRAQIRQKSTRATPLNIQKLFDFGGLERQRQEGFETKNKKKALGILRHNIRSRAYQITTPQDI